MLSFMRQLFLKYVMIRYLKYFPVSVFYNIQDLPIKHFQCPTQHAAVYYFLLFGFSGNLGFLMCYNSLSSLIVFSEHTKRLKMSKQTKFSLLFVIRILKQNYW